MLTYSEFLTYNEESNVIFNIYEDKVDVEKPKESVVKDFIHNFDVCLKLNRIESLILDIVLPKNISYTVQISYREERKKNYLFDKTNKRWQYTIKTKSGLIIAEDNLDDCEEILEENQISTKNQIIEILKYINYKEIVDVSNSVDKGEKK